MSRDLRVLTLAVIFLLLLLPLVAGCLSVPGPEGPKKTPAVTAVVTRSPQATATSAVPTVSATTATVTTTKAPATASATVLPSANTGYALTTCSDQGGFLVMPGQHCGGSWLSAVNTFSCCSAKPVAVAGSNRTLSAAPFTLTVNTDDSLGRIIP